MIKPIETEYKGYIFRSRLEARWALFFETMGYFWEYEPEGFYLPDGTRYIPDFYVEIPVPALSEYHFTFNYFVEVKPRFENMTDLDWLKVIRMNKESPVPMMLLVGRPDVGKQTHILGAKNAYGYVKYSRFHFDENRFGICVVDTDNEAYVSNDENPLQTKAILKARRFRYDYQK